MSFKRVLTYFIPLVILSAMFLAACGSTSTPSSGGSSKAPETVTIWHHWQGDYLTAKKAIFDAYMKAHPNVTINLVNQDQVVDKSVTAVKANNGPDIIAWVDDSLGKLASSRTV